MTNNPSMSWLKHIRWDAKGLVPVIAQEQGSNDVLIVESQVRTKLPEQDRGMTIFYATEDNQLVRNDPKQIQLPLRVVDIDQQHKELKEVI